MALPKTPSEYPELEKRRWKECFGRFSEEDQIKLSDSLGKVIQVASDMRKSETKFLCEKIENGIK